MSKAFTEISAGLMDAIEHAKGNSTGVVEHKPEVVNVKAIREKKGGRNCFAHSRLLSKNN